jgi:uncharacterized protein YjbJ (UPF0337 family)
MNKDQVKGRIEEATGKIKEVAGELVGDPALELEGVIRKRNGRMRAEYGDLRNRIRKGGH